MPTTSTSTLRFAIIVLALAAVPTLGAARIRTSGWCEQGGGVVITQQKSSTNKAQLSYPRATLTVYITGTSPLTQAILFSDAAGTPLANPLTCSTTAYFYFYTDSPTVDLTFSGQGITVPFTLGAISTTGGGGGGATIPNTTNTLRGDNVGGALAVTGTGTDCVLVNGTSMACNAGGSPNFPCTVTAPSTTCTHNLNTATPIVACYDGAGIGTSPAITRVNLNSTVITTNVNLNCVFNAAGIDGPAGPQGPPPTGITATVTVKGSDGNNCALTVVTGGITASTCP